MHCLWGYDSSPDGCTSIGGYQAIWPADWAGTGNGTYSATVDLTSVGLAGTGQWSLALFNGWGTAPEVTYDLSFTLDGVCTVTDGIAGCTQEFSCNYNRTPPLTMALASCLTTLSMWTKMAMAMATKPLPTGVPLGIMVVPSARRLRRLQWQCVSQRLWHSRGH